MFPLRDSIPSQRRPVVTIAIIAASSLTFLYQLTLGPALESFLLANAFVPARFFHPAAFAATVPGNLASLVVSMFLHGGWLHLIGNMWFLWVFGDNVEDTLGHGLARFDWGTVTGAGEAAAGDRRPGTPAGSAPPARPCGRSRAAPSARG